MSCEESKSKSAIFKAHVEGPATTHGHSRDLPQPPPELPVASGHDVTPVRGNAVDDAIICVGSLVRARQTLETGITGDAARVGRSAEVSLAR